MIICIYITREKEKSHMISQQSKLKLWLSVLIFLTVFSIFLILPDKIYASDGDAITYEPSEPFEYEYMVDGTSTGNRYYYFYSALHSYDRLTVTKEGITTVYVLRHVDEYGDWVFAPESGGSCIIPGEDILFTFDRDQSGWEVGTHYITVTYGEMTTTIPVEIKPNSVESIEYIPVSEDRFTFYEYTQGHPGTDENGENEWKYNWIGVRTGDQLKVKKIDGTQQIFTFYPSDERVLDENGNRVYVSDPGERDNWMVIQPGTYDDIFVIKYHGRTCSHPITLKTWESISAAKTVAKKQLNDDFAEYNEADYYPAGWALVMQYYNDGLTAIDNAETAWDAWVAYYNAERNGMGDVEYDYGRPDESDTTVPASTGNKEKPASSEPVVKNGGVYTSGGQQYDVTALASGNTGGEVAFKAAKNAKKVTVPATIKLADGKTYKVTQIEAKAFTGKAIRTVTIGKNIKKIKKNAFKGSKATKLILKTPNLTNKASVKGSLKGSKVKTVQVKAGKKYVKKYKKVFTKKNAGKKVKVK